MRKISIFISALFFAVFSFSQAPKANNLFHVKGDTISFFLDNTGGITTFEKAEYFRKAVFGSDGLYYSGIVSDYFMDGQKAYECNFSRSGLNGEVKSFYPNGKLRYSGFFNDSNRDSIWTFYYENGNIEKVIEVRDTEPYFKEFYRKNGKLVFNDGNGKYAGRIKHKASQIIEYGIGGRIVDGKMHGNWIWRSDFVRGSTRFDQGVAKTGIKTGGGYPEPEIPKIFGFDLHEEINIFKFFYLPLAEIDRNLGDLVKGMPMQLNNLKVSTLFENNEEDHLNQHIKYRSSIELNKALVQDISKQIAILGTENRIESFWGFIQFRVTENNTIEDLEVFSNNEVMKDGLISFLAESQFFEAPRVNGEVVPCLVYLSLLMEDKRMFVPQYSYLGFPSLVF